MSHELIVWCVCVCMVFVCVCEWLWRCGTMWWMLVYPIYIYNYTYTWSNNSRITYTDMFFLEPRNTDIHLTAYWFIFDIINLVINCNTQLAIPFGKHRRLCFIIRCCNIILSNSCKNNDISSSASVCNCPLSFVFVVNIDLGTHNKYFKSIKIDIIHILIHHLDDNEIIIIKYLIIYVSSNMIHMPHI